MKRSSKVALTLLVPSMAAFGCSQSELPKASPASVAAAGKSNPASPDQKEKEDEEFVVSQNDDDSQTPNPTSSNLNPTSTQTGQHYHHRTSFIPFFWGGASNRYQNSVPPRPMPVPTSPPSWHPTAGPVGNGVSVPHSTGAGISRGGFGGTGSHLSGGS
jgi:hypothetical protein